MVSRVPLNDLVRQNLKIRDDLIASASRVIDRGWFVLGSEGSQFETAFAGYCGAAHAIGLANGTDAIEIALRAVGVEAGDAVVTVANAGFYSSTAIHAIGALPVYVDVDATTHLMDVEALRRVLATQWISAVVVTHLYGRLADVEAIIALCDTKGIAVIEDCAQAHGAQRNGRRAGSFAKAGCFSFYPTKNLGALGDGGAITTNDAAIAADLRELRQYGWDRKYRVNRAGGCNSRLDEMQAALLLTKLPHLDAWNEERRNIARRYASGVTHPAIQCPRHFGLDNVVHLFVMRCKDRDRFRQHLDANGIASDIHYPIPDHRQPAYVARHNDSSEMLTETESLAGEIVTIPCFNGMEEGEIERVIAVANSW
ncbi:DegT/DnrJ/EryC1/StrS family aminotransferase [Bradyrhizobium sp. RDM12]